MNKLAFFFLLFTVFAVRPGYSQDIVPTVKDGSPQVVFEAHPLQLYGFDGFAVPEWSTGYGLWTNAGQTDYKIPYKSVGYKQTDLVNARIVNGPGIDPDSLFFRIEGSGRPVGFTVRKRKLVSLLLPEMGGNYVVTAWYNGAELGRMQVVVYRKKEEKVVIVPLMNVQIDTDSLTAALNRIYGQADMELHVEVKPAFRHEEVDPKQLFDNPSPAFDRYTAQMRDLRDLYFDNHPEADRNAYYIFLVPGFVNPKINGYMVRSKSIGFVTATATRFTQSIARQLARGIGKLTDSWYDEGPLQGTTDNLMDRAPGTHLTYVQWEDLRLAHSYSMYDNYEDVRTNNGIVAYYFWKEDAKGNIVTDRNGLLLSIKRPYKKNYRSYHLNIDNFFFKTLFKIKGKPICLWHILAALVVCTGVFLLGRRFSRRVILRFIPKPRWYRFSFRIFQLLAAAYLAWLSFLLVNSGYGWYEVHSGPIAELYKQSTYRTVELIADNVNYRHPTEKNLCSELLIRRGDTWSMLKQRQVLYFSVTQDDEGDWSRLRFLGDRDSLILHTQQFGAPAKSHYLVFNYTRRDGSFERQQVFNHLGIDITDKLHIQDPAKRILLFVNGYRPTSIGHTFEENFRDIQLRGLEFPDSKNLVYNFDRYDYWHPWQEIDVQFQRRINPGETFYADGHFSVTTSNHRSLLNFSTISTIYPKRCPDSRHHVCYSTTSVQTGFFGSRRVKTASLHNMHPNRRGFEKRRQNGRVAGRNIYQMLNELPNGSKNDTLYIVAHSMGYAYALGIIDELRGKIRFGALYIIAPENASCGEVKLSEWDEVWQYGSNFNPGQADAPCLLDGVAPQARAGGLKSGNRIYIPKQFYEKKGFFDSHFIGYYTWVLGIPEGKRGYVRQR